MKVKLTSDPGEYYEWKKTIELKSMARRAEIRAKAVAALNPPPPPPAPLTRRLKNFLISLKWKICCGRTTVGPYRIKWCIYNYGPAFPRYVHITKVTKSIFSWEETIKVPFTVKTLIKDKNT